jgi:hypothetical protein
MMGRHSFAGRPLRVLAAVAAAALLSACTNLPALDADTVIARADAEAGPPSPERAAALAEIRARAEAGAEMPFPDVFRADTTAALAARGEPLTMAEVQAIRAELAFIAERRAATTDAMELAALDARAQELRRLMAARPTELR